jgi:hypothetical protein
MQARVVGIGTAHAVRPDGDQTTAICGHIVRYVSESPWPDADEVCPQCQAIAAGDDPARVAAHAERDARVAAVLRNRPPGIPALTLTVPGLVLVPLSRQHLSRLVEAMAEDEMSSGRDAGSETADVRADEFVSWAARLTADGIGRIYLIQSPAGEAVLGTLGYIDAQWAVVGEPPEQSAVVRAVSLGGLWLPGGLRDSRVFAAATLCLLTHAFEALGVSLVRIFSDANDDDVRTALTELGAWFEGVARGAVAAPDGSRDVSARFSVSDSEWPAVKSVLSERLAPG